MGIVGLSSDDLRTDVVDSAAEGFAGSGSVDCPAEIGQLDSLFVENEDVFGFEIAVDDVELMQVLHCWDYLACVGWTSAFLEFSVALQDGVKLTSGGVLHDDVNPFFVEEEPVHLEDVFVLEVAVDLDFSSELVDDIRVDELLFWENFQGHNVLCFALACQVDVTIPKWLRKYLPRPMCLPIWKSSTDHWSGEKILPLTLGMK